jgi:hypothetical protein
MKVKLRLPCHFDIRKKFNEYTKTYELEYEDKNSSIIMFSRKFIYPALLHGYKLWYYEVWVSYGKLNKYGYQITSNSFYKTTKSYEEARSLFNKLLKLNYDTLKETLSEMYVNQEIKSWIITDEL